jgi:hypothetical protein
MDPDPPPDVGGQLAIADQRNVRQLERRPGRGRLERHLAELRRERELDREAEGVGVAEVRLDLDAEPEARPLLLCGARRLRRGRAGH